MHNEINDINNKTLMSLQKTDCCNLIFRFRKPLGEKLRAFILVSMFFKFQGGQISRQFGQKLIY